MNTSNWPLAQIALRQHLRRGDRRRGRLLTRRTFHRLRQRQNWRVLLAMPSCPDLPNTISFN